MGVVKLADYRPQLEVVEHRVADTAIGSAPMEAGSIPAATTQTEP